MRYLLLSNGDAGTPPGSAPSAAVTMLILQAEEAGAIFLSGAIERPAPGGSPATAAGSVGEFAIVDVASRAEAEAWAGRLAAASGTSDIEVRRVYLPEDRPAAREGVG